MGVLKTFLFGLTLAFCGAGQPVAAQPGEAGAQVKLFATCLGRFSATMEHEWLLGRDGQSAAAQRQMFELLIEAVLPDARSLGITAAHVLNLRIEAKHAQARLLQTAHFQLDPRRKRYAARLVERDLASCNSLLLG